ncbi:thiamine pyrophosphate-dependent dehydrogenase E1 component subunit alpha [Sphingosinicella sp. LY1275]|uniref:thiamine pyrophosphate-dependent dehydrogenase E1 component subunit alpha n=1 Tax=Sphingosinicella sp. LY1275 TaxID=3095379 RepID=UPI002ADEEB14|nr:thiamine pyrophosphate-dependent dehydrogenase E1 component subunit alpha [Sphingosinicella sp. LY1275]MEA1015358.1 thiamine pyrophosphate-dependent dehydrogenase E1 component subunit alpha [Sphingosinicella sp. LY1275]
MTDQQLLHAYRIMERAILLEQAVLRLIEEGSARLLLHSGRGQEAIGTGACAALRDDDMLFYSHRGLTQLLAKGMAPGKLLGDFLGRVDGATGGLGAGIVHAVDPSIGLMGSSGTLGGGFVLSAGAALGARKLGDDRVSVHIFGEGSANRGTFHEAANAAALWKLPMVWLCENNGLSVSVAHRDATSVEDVADRAAAYGMPSRIVDGQDVEAVFDAVSEAVARARSGEGPTLIEAKTLRFRGHYEGDPQTYRNKDDMAAARLRDPQLIAAERLAARGIGADRLEALRQEEASAMDAAVAAALTGAKPGPGRIFEGLLAPRSVSA